MAAESPGRARACFDLKRTTFPLFSLVLRSTDLAELQREFQARLGDAPDFFDHDLLVLNLSSVQRDDNDLDFRALVALLRRYGLQPIGVHGGSPAQMSAAAEAGLVQTPEVSAANSMARAGRSEQAELDSATPAEVVAGNDLQVAGGGGSAAASVADAGAASGGNAGAASGGDAGAASGTRVESASPASPQAPEMPAPHGKTVVIDKPLRSGQRIYAKNADLVVLEVVSFGAEIFADGNIHVYAPLRGRAIAGARGNASARIFTTCLDPQLVAIAGVYRTIESRLPDEVAGKPAQVRRVGDSLLIEPL